MIADGIQPHDRMIAGHLGGAIVPESGPLSRRVRQPAGVGWVQLLLVASMLFQLGVFALGNTPIRLPMRVGAYGLSLALIYFVKGRYAPHPAAKWATFAVIVLLIGMLHPDGDRLVARIACVTLYTAVLSPLFWVGRLQFGPRGFRTVLLIMWGFYTAGAFMGALQIRFPGRFDGATAITYDDASLDMHQTVTADGSKVAWPKGLTDTPGGASNAGMSSIVLGLGLLLTETNAVILAATVAGMMAGLFCIYICQERTNLVVVSLCAIAVLVTVLRRGAWGRAAMLISVGFGVAVAGTTIAFTVGGAVTSSRFGTLIADDPSTVFHANRGHFLEDVLTRDVFDMPLGAGEGRWGLVSGTFGKSVKTLWAEMMWQSLLFDGGIPLMLAYAGMLASLVWTAWRLAVGAKSVQMCCFAGTVMGYTLAAVAATFVYPIFAMQAGMEVILLNACLFAASRGEMAPPASGLILSDSELNGPPMRWEHGPSTV